MRGRDDASGFTASAFCGRSLINLPSLACGITGRVNVGLGRRLMLVEETSLIGEWTPVLAGGETGTDTWGIGVEAKEGGHAFHVFVTDACCLTPNRYIPGGDLNDNGAVRLGCNIYRTL